MYRKSKLILLVCVSKQISSKSHSKTPFFGINRCFTDGSKPRNIILSAGNYELQASRSYMEDRFVQSSDSTLCTVFDGHGGDAVAHIMAENFENVLKNDLATHTAPYTNEQLILAINSSISYIDNFVQSDKKLNQIGAAVSVSYINLNPSQPSIITANAGDSRVVLSRNKIAIALTTDHKPNDPLEKARIEKLGGFIKKAPRDCWRVQGCLAMSRALGDKHLKPFVSSEMDFTVRAIEDGDEFVIVATDGIWDVFTNQGAVSFVHQMLIGIDEVLSDPNKISQFYPYTEGHTDPKLMRPIMKKMIARLLVETAVQRDPGDNATAIIQWIDRDVDV